MSLRKPASPGTSDGGLRWEAKHGVSGVPVTSANATAGVAATDAPATSQRLVATDFAWSCEDEQTITFKEETTGVVIAGPFYCQAGGVYQYTPRGMAHVVPTAGKKIYGFASGSGNVMFDVSYFSEPV